ncbi:MAG: hypothetical protein HDQ95_16280 [Roseburia sp.]|nr:hypothetical protein [Roseburia sp.]
MKHIIGAFGTLIVLVLNIFICIAVSNASSRAAAAREYKADVIAEIENSNFNPSVINSCIAQADAEGYTLQITPCTYDEDGCMQTAEVILSYSYELPIFGISETKSTRGIAR